MADINQDNVRIQVLVTEDTEFGPFQDALYFTPEEFEDLSEKALTDLKTERVEKWVENIETASARDYTPSVEDLEVEKANLEARIQELDNMLLTKE